MIFSEYLVKVQTRFSDIEGTNAFWQLRLMKTDRPKNKPSSQRFGVPQILKHVMPHTEVNSASRLQRWNQFQFKPPLPQVISNVQVANMSHFYRLQLILNRHMMAYDKSWVLTLEAGGKCGSQSMVLHQYLPEMLSDMVISWRHVITCDIQILLWQSCYDRILPQTLAAIPKSPAPPKFPKSQGWRGFRTIRELHMVFCDQSVVVSSEYCPRRFQHQMKRLHLKAHSVGT